MRRLIKNVIIVFLVIICILGLIYLGLGYYYVDSFSYGTRINGVYCTGHNQKEVNELLNEKYKYEGIWIKSEYDDTNTYISAEDIDFKYDFKESLEIYLREQNSWLWPLNLLETESKTLLPKVKLDEDKLNSLLNDIELLNYEVRPDVSIEIADGELVLVDTVSNRPDCAKMKSAITLAIYNSEEEIVFDDSFYVDEQYTSQQLQTIQTYSELKEKCKARITYTLGKDTEKIDAEVLLTFLDSPFDDELSWNEECIEEWVDCLADKYDSIGTTRAFHTSQGEDILIEGGIYGNEIDRITEKKYLIDAIKNGYIESHEPAYKQKAFCQGINDIGDTYIEVDMTDQHMYYYINGELVIETPIVTGNLRTGCRTPTGTNYIYFKQLNRVLVGPTYRTPVDYWMAVKGHIGIHDATWRSEFGGDIYKTNGSHGCINTPMDAVSKMYELAEVGTPVVMYYNETE